jgi:hypothetical protein
VCVSVCVYLSLCTLLSPVDHTECRLVSEGAGLFTSEAIAKDIVNGMKNYRFFVQTGFEGTYSMRFCGWGVFVIAFALLCFVFLVEGCQVTASFSLLWFSSPTLDPTSSCPVFLSCLRLRLCLNTHSLLSPSIHHSISLSRVSFAAYRCDVGLDRIRNGAGDLDCGCAHPTVWPGYLPHRLLVQSLAVQSHLHACARQRSSGRHTLTAGIHSIRSRSCPYIHARIIPRISTRPLGLLRAVRFLHTLLHACVAALASVLLFGSGDLVAQLFHTQQPDAHHQRAEHRSLYPQEVEPTQSAESNHVE